MQCRIIPFAPSAECVRLPHMKKFALLALPFLAAACVQEGPRLPPVGIAAEAGSAVAEDTCGAARFTFLVGEPQSALEGVGFPAETRIIPPDTVVTQDFRADRLNVVIDGNAEVERVYCG